MNIDYLNNFVRRACLRFLLVGLALFLNSGTLFAASTNLAWDPSSSVGVGGYKVSYGTSSGSYTSTIDVGNTTAQAVSGLQEGTKYYFAVKAYDSAKTTESAYSNEINTTIPVATTALTADFTASKTSGTYPMVVSFTPVTTGAVTGYNWNFGDSSIASSTSQYPTVTYANPGTYNVSLTVTGSSGSVTKTKSSFIIASEPLVANYSATSTSGVAPVTVSFTDTSTGSITSRSWSFGDGTTSTAINPSHIYSVTGSYTASLTVTGTGGSNTKTGTISVTAPAVITPPPTSNNSGLVAAYGFEETSGTTVTDASGNGNHGTINEAARITAGKFGKALQFDGINDWVTANDSTSLALSTGMTLEAWVYPQSQASWNTVIMKESSAGLSYALYANDDRNLPGSYVSIGSDRPVTGTNGLPVNQWTHLVSTYDGQYQRLYVNGVEVAQSAQSGLFDQSTGVLRIGGNSVWGEYFKGYIDEVRIYNRALSATEVSNNLKTAVSATSTPPQLILGNNNEEPWKDLQPKGVAQAFQAVAAKSGSVTEVKVYLDASTTATKLVAGIYKNNNGHPGARITQATATLSQSELGAWKSVVIPAAAVTAGQTYWIAILGTNGQIGFRDQVGSGTGILERSYSSSLTSLPSTWRTSTNGYKTNANMSIYGTGK